MDHFSGNYCTVGLLYHSCHKIQNPRKRNPFGGFEETLCQMRDYKRRISENQEGPGDVKNGSIYNTEIIGNKISFRDRHLEHFLINLDLLNHLTLMNNSIKLYI